MDEFARMNSLEYADAYRRLAELYSIAKDQEKANRMLERALIVEDALGVN
jgi:hypothetical protein